jgi:hypothetical protein
MFKPADEKAITQYLRYRDEFRKKLLGYLHGYDETLVIKAVPSCSVAYEKGIVDPNIMNFLIASCLNPTKILSKSISVRMAQDLNFPIHKFVGDCILKEIRVHPA